MVELAVLKDAADAGVELYVESGKLKARCLKGAMTASLQASIKEHKERILTYLSNAIPNTDSRRLPEIKPLERNTTASRASFAQERLWLTDQMSGVGHHYNIHGVFRSPACNGKTTLDVDVAQQAFRCVVLRHETLRTRIYHNGLNVVQEVRPGTDFQIELVSIHWHDDQEVARLIDEHRQQRFDFSTGELLSVKYIESSDGESFLSVCMPHIASDGWSEGILIQEFNHFYSAISSRREHTLPTLPIQYRDYSQWQRDWIDSGGCQGQLDYWRKKLDGAPACHSIPLKGARRGDTGSRGETITAPVPEYLNGLLKKLISNYNLTPFMFFHAVVSVLLARHSNSEDVLIGVPTASRLNSQLDPLIGFFVNTIVLRTICNEHQPFSNYLKYIRDVNLEAQSNQGIPFSYLVEKLNPQRGAGVSPFFQILLTMDTDERASLNLGDIALEQVVYNDKTAKYDLTFAISEVGSGYSISLNFDCFLFDSTTANALLGRMISLIKSCLADPEIELFKLSMVSDQEQRELDLISQKEESAFSSTVVHQHFERFAALNPSRIAVQDADSALSYRELNERANQVARYLQNRGVKPNQLVGLCNDRSVGTYVALLAVWKAGLAYLPLEADFPKERLEQLIRDTEVTLVLTDKRSSAYFQDYAECISLDDDETVAQLERHHKSNLKNACERSEARLAYVIYTSGSTGTPKGVMIDQANISHYVAGVVERHRIPEGLKYAVLTTITTDLGNTTIFLALSSGGTLVIADRETAVNDKLFSRFLEQSQIDVLKLTPSHLAALAGNRLAALISELKFVFVGGESVPPTMLKAFEQAGKLGSCRFVGHYGPTETTIGFSTHEIGPHTEQGASIGTPLLNGRFSLRDSYGRSVPNGVPGELYISGPGVARGYLNRPELTKEKFISESDACGNVRRLYRTGDWVVISAEGNLRFLGRMDNQIKLRGFRIELGEIEQSITRCGNIESALVRCIKKAGSDQQELVAYVKQVSRDSPLDVGDIARALALSLPGHMIPQQWVDIEYWPLTSNGKIDHRALPVPTKKKAVRSETLSENAKRLHSVCASILKLQADALDFGSSFLELGGHSLLAMQLVSSVRQEFGIDLTIHDVFNAPTMESMLRSIESIKKSDPQPQIMRCHRSDRHPLSYGQQLIWFIHLMEGGSAHYNMPSVLHIEGSFDERHARASFQSVVNRHDILRSVYAADNGVPYQKVLREAEFLLPVIDLSALPGEQQSDELRRLIADDAMLPFDLSCEMVIRAKFIRLAPTSGKLVFNMHHIASDGWSMRILMEEFSRNYSQLMTQNPVPDAELGVQYGDYCSWQREFLQGSRVESQLQYWHKQLAGIPKVHSLPLDSPRPESRSFLGAGVTTILDETAVERLKKIARSSSSTLFMVLHAAFSLILSRHSNSADIIIGTPVANRLNPAVEPLIGFFVNTLVLRTAIDSGMSFSSLLKHVREVNLSAQANQDVPFELVVERLNPLRSMQYSPLFQIMFTLDENASESSRVADFIITSEFHTESVSKFELTVDATALKDGYFFNFQYNTEVFREERIKQIASDFMRLLGSIAESPESRIGELKPCVSCPPVFQPPKPRSMALKGDFFDTCFSGLARKFSDRPAVESDDQSLTYRELEDRSNKLAAVLQALGVCQGHKVCLLMDRSVDMVASILALFKVGATYIPLDVDYPASRKTEIIRSCQASWCLTYERHQNDGPSEHVRYLALDSSEVKAALARVTSSYLKPERDNASAQEAYIMYTSGSTGKPKGVIITHANLIAYAKSAIKAYDIDFEDRILQFSSPSFDIFVEEMCMSLLSGGCLVVRDEGMLSGGDYFWSRIERTMISTLSLPTGFWHQLAKDVKPQFGGYMKTLKRIIVGGERLSAKAVRRWHENIGASVLLINTYGPTEATVVASVFPIVDQRVVTENIPIGRALGHCKMVVLAPDGSVAPIGATGELYIGGESLSPGYLGDDALTASRFIQGGYSGQRMYRTGDLARVNQQGCFEFMGRTDGQVKIRGYRVEPAEIENALLALDEVDNAVVISYPVAEAGSRLCAYVSLTQRFESELTQCQTQIRDRLAELLPVYMIPDVVIVEDFPLTVNGKIDKKQLPAPQASKAYEVLEVASGRLETSLLSIWSELLQKSPSDIGTTCSFFDLGGSSMMTARMIIRIFQELGVEIAVRDVFRHPTIRGLANYIESDRAVESPLMSMLYGGEGGLQNLFCIPGALGSAASFLALSSLSGKCNVYGFDHRGIFGKEQPHQKIGDMVECITREIKSCQPGGRYFVLGHSMGAKIAYEVCRRLELQGNTAHLIALDSEFKKAASATPAISPSCGPAQTREHPTAPSSQDMDRAMPYDSKIQKLVSEIEEAIGLNSNSDGLRQHLESMYNHQAELSSRHRVTAPLSNEVLLLLAEDSEILPSSTFSHLTNGSVSISTIPGDHYTMLSVVGAPKIAECVSAFIRSVISYETLSD